MARWHTFHVNKPVGTGHQWTRDVEPNAIVAMYETPIIQGHNPHLLTIQFNATRYTPGECVAWLTERNIVAVAGTVPTAKGEERPIRMIRHDWTIFRFGTRKEAEGVSQALRLLKFESSVDPSNPWIATNAPDRIVKAVAYGFREVA